MDKEAVLVGLGFCAALCAFGVALHYEGKTWDEFRTVHRCRVVAHIDGAVFNTLNFGPDGTPGIGVGSTPDKTGWLCDDGITYYR